jgi:4-carboxymuconolactone decarboxylase
MAVKRKERRKPRKLSPLMKDLYGEKYSKEVFERLDYLDRELNNLIQEVPYGMFWSRPGLSLRDKSLVTIAALIAQGRDEQTKIHMRGFLKSGGTMNELRNALIHLAVYCGFPAALNGFAALRSIPDPRRRSQGRIANASRR